MHPTLNYFDLNKRLNIKSVLPEEVNLSSARDNSTAMPPPGTIPFGARSLKQKRIYRTVAAIPVWQQAIFYLSTVVGVLLSSSVMQFQAGKAVTISFTVITVLLAAIIALILMPVTYEQAIKPHAPLIVQLGLFIQAGVFWSVVFTTIGKAYG